MVSNNEWVKCAREMTFLLGACAHTFQRWPTAAVCRGVQDNQPVEVDEALRREGEVGRVLHATGASWKSRDCRSWQSLSPVRGTKPPCPPHTRPPPPNPAL